MRRAISIILSIILIMAFSVQALAIKSIPVKSIKLNSSAISLNAGQTYDLDVTYTPANTTQILLKYATANKKIASINGDGKITAVGAGKTTITVASASNGNVVAQITVTVKAYKPITLHVLGQQASNWNDFPNNPVAKYIKKKLGLTIDMQFADKDKFHVLVAGGDLPDIVQAMNKPDDQQFTMLMKAKQVLDLTKLIQTNGKDMLKSVPKMLEFTKKRSSNNTGKIFFLNAGSGLDPSGVSFGIGPIIRWDYYKELGYPKIKNEDDLLNVINQMVKKHPKTADGKPTFGLSFWSDWGNWSLGMMTAAFYAKSSGMADAHDPLLKYEASYTDPNSNYWTGIKFAYKANKLGIFDTDSLVQGYEDVHTKATNGQILFDFTNWQFDAFNLANAKNKIGYEALPLEWADQWFGADNYAGYDQKAWAISSSCKVPDRAMDFLNWCYSYEGTRVIMSGVKGQHWDIGEDGKAYEFDSVVRLKTLGDPTWLSMQIGTASGLNQLCGLSSISINPADKTEVSLFDTPEMYNSALNPLQKDFSNHYGVKYPAQAQLKLLGKLKPDGKNKVLNQASNDAYIYAAIPPQPEDLKTIVAKIDTYFTSAAAKCILSKSDAEYEANRKKAIEDINDLGYKKVTDWQAKAWAAAKKEFGLK
jgi:putative aldouronate transport system substrate-binding protein